jgi:hypothetical protein
MISYTVREDINSTAVWFFVRLMEYRGAKIFENTAGSRGDAGRGYGAGLDFAAAL